MSDELVFEAVRFERSIFSIHGDHAGPSLVFIAGMHGNEASGVEALKELGEELSALRPHLHGAIHAISGNLGALNASKRFLHSDLNRIWSSTRVKEIRDGTFLPVVPEEREQVELLRLIDTIIAEEGGPYYFMDLHSTSSETIPFIVMNDSLLNRNFTQNYPLPIVLGIEEYLEGPLLSYINELGYVAFGFEAGQHDAPNAVIYQKAFARLTIGLCGSFAPRVFSAETAHEVLLKASEGVGSFYEIFYRYQIKENESFSMHPGYLNFQRISVGQRLAMSDGKPIYATINARVFMPLYQSQGEEGFFAIRSVPVLFLRLSAFLRTLKVDRILALLPGVKWTSESRDSLLVNRKIARFFTKQFFHLLGYRSRLRDKDYYIMKSREAASKRKVYKRAPWASSMPSTGARSI
ncbi:MAG: succinylglutamate desuccinylase/aspartoacylase family protein [Cryomorphaceae bacterium]